jgi:hypothetical protein
MEPVAASDVTAAPDTTTSEETTPEEEVVDTAELPLPTVVRQPARQQGISPLMLAVLVGSAILASFAGVGLAGLALARVDDKADQSALNNKADQSALAKKVDTSTFTSKLAEKADAKSALAKKAEEAALNKKIDDKMSTAFAKFKTDVVDKQTGAPRLRVLLAKELTTAREELAKDLATAKVDLAQARTDIKVQILAELEGAGGDDSLKTTAADAKLKSK